VLYEIIYNDIENKEVQAIIKLLEMEHMSWVFTDSMLYLKYTNGIPIPVIINKSENDDIIIGFYKLVKYIQDNGLCLC
jgi:hypothetical protein